MPSSEDHTDLAVIKNTLEHIKTRVDDLFDGKAGVCARHAEQLKSVWANIGRLWWAVAALFAALGIKWVISG